MTNIRPLCQTPEIIPVVASWIWNAFWSDGQGRGYSVTDIAEKLALATEDALPMAWVAWHERKPVGCVNLIENDDEARQHLRPWIAALYVEPDYRKRGVALDLIETVLSAAAGHGESECFLGTDIPSFYLKQGARIIEHEPENNHYVMAFQISSTDG
ncbi:GNAT family N-acetyltransferase [Saccharospirillum salsuginis]|uniref:N-acetyltransferase n=1 Tax=Saccharospirillum salsuginis TaxID=418750 RepID=A0A918JZH5_9GAMM|nr:GNAT family N-acetyltransferase [Saccharospirillum salsuginis]GGX38696.1 N-acetyltransferase [Saccharospirillum salsuginis]